ncbi:MAG: nicotinamidase [Gammaproteobacteria bacterium]|jgi:nicotinamidase/pyrazinamidase|nr:nicotinamidase [Gammaproteobacteria bacterium]
MHDLIFKKSQVASLDIDAQKTFTPLCPHELPVPEGDQIASQLNAQAQYAQWRIGSKDAHSLKAVWISDDAHPPLSRLEAPHADCYWPPHAIPGSIGFDLLDELPVPSEYDYFVWKGIELDMHPYGACYHDLRETLSTGIIEFLQARGILAVIVGGLATDYCVKTTVLQLRRAGIAVFINLAATRGIQRKTTENAISEMRTAGGIVLQSSEELRPYIQN